MQSKNIIAFRKHFGLSQEMLAYITDLSQETICNIEAGRRSPSIEMGLKMVKFAKERKIELHLEELFGSENIIL